MTYNKDLSKVIKDKSARLYFEDIASLYKLGTVDVKVLYLIIEAIKANSSQSINMHPKVKKEFAKRLGMKNHIQVTNALHNLVSAGVINKIEPDDRYDFTYTVNPDILLDSDDYNKAGITIKYNKGKRKIKAFTS